MRPSVMTGVDCNDAETLVRDVIASCKLIAPKAPLVLCYYPWHDSGPFPPPRIAWDRRSTTCSPVMVRVSN